MSTTVRSSPTSPSEAIPRPTNAPLTGPATMEISPDPWPLFRFSVSKYQQLVHVGVLGEDDAVELLEGLVVSKISKIPRHDSTVDRCGHWLTRAVPSTWYVRIQNSLVTSDSVPEPDLAIVRGEPGDYDERHPTGADTALVIEVAESSLAIDREKAKLYARAGVENYWIANLTDDQIEVFSVPRPRTDQYLSVQIATKEDHVEFTLPTGERIQLDVATLLPKKDAK